jgi:hypothetical protein
MMMMIMIIIINSDTSNVIGATGISSKSLRKYLSKIMVKHKIKEVQTITVLGTARILWKVQT